MLLSPTPLPAVKQRDLPTTPISVPIHGTPSPMLTQVEEERLDLAAEESNAGAVDTGADDSGRCPGRVNEGTNGGVSWVHGDVVSEKAPPPTPAKDGDAARSIQAVVPGHVSEGTS